MLPLEPAAVVPAGREVTFAAVANSMVLVDGFAWRLLPLVRASLWPGKVKRRGERGGWV